MTMKKQTTRPYERPLVTVVRMNPSQLLDGSQHLSNEETEEQYSKRNDMFDTDWEEEN